jgi:transposase InsO family protein
MPGRRGRRRRGAIAAQRRADPDRLRQEIKETFRRPGHKVAFSAPGNVARSFGITQEKARQILEEVDSYVSHREYKRPSVFNPYYVYKRRELIQADLIDISELRAFNSGVRYLLLIIDVFTKKIWVYPLKTKEGIRVRDSLEDWLDRIGNPPPEVFATDAGNEFYNQHVRTLLNSRGVRQEKSVGTCKAAVAERANKSLQVLLYKYMSEMQTKTYLDKLDKIVETYNKRGHRTLNFMSPNMADLPRNEAEVRGFHVARYAKIKKKKLKFNVGEVVRIKLESKVLSPQSRAYKPQFKGEYFVIREINTRLPIPLYYLKAMENNEEIKGGFYSNELTAVRGDEFKVERVLDERGEGPNKELLVRWMHFGPDWDSWIPASSVRFYNNNNGARGRARGAAARGRRRAR